jgi:serine/threonine protein kinase
MALPTFISESPAQLSWVNSDAHPILLTMEKHVNLNSVPRIRNDTPDFSEIGNSMGCHTSLPAVHPAASPDVPIVPEPPPADSVPVPPSSIPPLPLPGVMPPNHTPASPPAPTPAISLAPAPDEMPSILDDELEGPISLQLSPSFFNPHNKPVIFEYKVVRHIGRGAHSDVFLMFNSEKQQYFAAKVYSKAYLTRVSISSPEPPFEKLMREIEIMSQLDHPNCINLVEVIDDEETNSLLLVLPYADDGALSSCSWKSDKIPEVEAQVRFAQIARGLQHLHSRNIVHRDLKPDNILKFKDGRAVLADFSVSLKLEDGNQLLLDTDGTPAYYAPEECMGEPYLGKPADVWAFGMVLYIMIYGTFPYLSAVHEATFYTQFMKIARMIISEEYGYPDTVPISPALRDFFSHVLEKDPAKRFTIDQALEHPWLKNAP